MNCSKLLLIIIFSIALVSRTSAQEGCYTCSQDSLINQLAVTSAVAEKVKLLQWIIDFAPTTDSANYYLEQLFSYKANLKHKELVAYRKIHLGNVYRIRNENELALQLYHEAVSLFDEQQKKIPMLLLGFRNLYNLLNRQEDRYQYYKSKLNYYLSKGPYENTAAAYHGIGGYFAFTADYNQAISYYLRAAEVFKKFYPFWHYNAMGIVGVYYAEWGNYSKALDYLNYALPHIKATKGVLETANGYYEWQLAQIKFDIKKYDEALEHANVLITTFNSEQNSRFYAIGLLYKGLSLVAEGNPKDAYPILLKAKQVNNTKHKGRMTTFNSTVEIDYGLYYYYNRLQQYATAEKHLKEAYRKAVVEQTNRHQLKYLLALADVTAKQQKFQLSRSYTEAYNSLSSQLDAEYSKFKTAQYENEQKSIEQLQNINALKQERAVQEATLNKRNTILIISVIGLLLISISMVVLYRQLRINKETLRSLKATQSQLIQSEKMASLGELTAGIAHEIQNPLNFVNNFSEVSTELVDELQMELKQGNASEALVIATDVKENLSKINHHGKRADAIVKNMLQHSRVSSGVKEPIDINVLVDECLRLSYHGLRANDKNFNAKLETYLDASVKRVNAVPQDISRVFINLFNNAFYSVTEKKKHLNGLFEPTISITTQKENGKVVVRVWDNGLGISKMMLDKIYQPFFTTKPTGEGTGLGLSISYDIIKAHGGDMKVNSEEGNFAEFVIELPITKEG